MNRPKRVIAKPSRYVTTSSDEAPKRRRMAETNIDIDDIEDDIDNIRNFLEKDNLQKDHNENLPITTKDKNDLSRTHTHALYNCTTDNTNVTPSDYGYNVTGVSQGISQMTDTQPTRSSTYSTNLYVQENDMSNTQLTRALSAHHTQESNLIYDMDKCIGIPSTSRESNDNFQPEMMQTNRIPVQAERINDRSLYLLHDRMIRMEVKMNKTNALLHEILKCVQDQPNISQKPAVLPISSLAEMENFEIINNDEYGNVVNYLRNMGGFNLKEAINLSFKEAMKDSLTTSLTWFGREGRKPLYNTRLIMAIYQAVCANRHFPKPTRSEFQALIREALRTAKERLRHKVRDIQLRRAGEREVRRNLWNNEQENVEDANE